MPTYESGYILVTRWHTMPYMTTQYLPTRLLALAQQRRNIKTDGYKDSYVAEYKVISEDY